MEAISYEIHEGPALKRIISTVRDEWIYDAFGGLQGAAEALNMTRQAVHYMHKTGIRNRDVAIKVHEALKAERGRVIPVEELLELPAYPWRGPERHGNGNGHAGNGSVGKGARRARSAPPAPAHVSARARRHPTQTYRLRLVGERERNGTTG